MIVSNELPTGPHFISLSRAAAMAGDYRNTREYLLPPDLQGMEILPLSETFNRAAFDTLLAKPGCKGIRIYYGLDEDSKLHAMLVAVNAQNEDMLADSFAATEPADIAEQGQRCPDVCPPASPLNS